MLSLHSCMCHDAIFRTNGEYNISWKMSEMWSGEAAADYQKNKNMVYYIIL